MAYETKEQERKWFIAEFLRQVREAPPGTRVNISAEGVFGDAEVVKIDDLRAARESAANHNDNEGGDSS